MKSRLSGRGALPLPHGPARPTKGDFATLRVNHETDPPPNRPMCRSHQPLQALRGLPDGNRLPLPSCFIGWFTQQASSASPQPSWWHVF